MIQSEVLQELKELNSPLAELPRVMPYDVPEGYFESLPMAALQTVKASNIPAGYFESLPKVMLQVAKASEVPAKKSARIIALPVLRWAAAALLLVLLGIGGSLFRSKSNSSSQETIAELPPDAVYEYVAEIIEGPDFASTNDVSLATSGALVPHLSGLSDGELEAYLAEEGVLF